MNISELKDKKILIVGYGKEGKSVEAFLKEKLPSVNYEIADESQGPQYLDRQNEFDIAVKSPGVHKSKLTIPYTTATNLFFGNVDQAVTIGVTGSKGKSTTTSVIHHILKQDKRDSRLTGNIGNPLLSELLKDYSKDTIFVCELSSYQLSDLTYSPHISVIVSLFPEHVDYHGSVEAYYEAKKNILTHATSADFYIYNPKYKLLSEWAQTTPVKSLTYDEEFVPKSTPLLGAHNLENLQVAAQVAHIFNITNNQIETAIQSFKPLPHRLQNVGTYKGITFYNDAISTTPESTIAALRSLQNVKTIFLGGTDRGYDFTELITYLSVLEIENIVLFPDTGKRILTHIQEKFTKQPRILETQDMEKAVQFAYAHTPENAICLLSTASPSYSVWKNFEEKGDLFQTFVKKYASQEAVT